MKLRNALLLSLFTGLVPLHTVQADEWPYPEDVPKVSPVNIGVASDRPIDISRFLMVRSAVAASLNKSSSHIAFISNVTGRRQLWVMPAKGGQAKQLTFGNGITFYRWHPDGQRLLYGADNNGDEREAFYLISIDGREESVALPYSHGFRSFGAFDKEGKRFTYASTERNGRDFDLYMYDFGTAKSRMIYQAEFGFFPSQWRPGTNELLVEETRGEDANNLYVLNTDNGKLTTVFKPEIAAAYEDFNWEPSGKGFYYTSNQDGEMKSLQYYDFKAGKAKTLVQSEYDIENITLCNKGKHLFWTENRDGFDTLYLAPSSNMKATEISMSLGTISVSCSEGKGAIINHFAPNDPGTLSHLNLNTLEQTTLLTPDMAGINPAELIMPESIRFPARDKVMLQGLLYLPKTSQGNKPPLVIDIHGGPTAQSRASWGALTQYLVGKGIAVLEINVRGSTGFGKTYTRLDNQEKRLDSVRDLVDALKWLKQDGRVDADRAAAIGGSYGGYMVNAVMGAYPDAFKAGASFVGVADWVRALETASPGLKASDRIEYGDITEQRWKDFYAKNSPVNTIHQIKAPMFFEHGVNDPRDPVTESDTMVKALRDKNIPVTYLRFPDEGHSIRKLENRVTFFRQLAEFLEKHL
ncbi:S9 family peptidase [Alteromonadaceae bacterium M269]|nr:S9 family peptidase [Alteromonadaceae bacterium M269]